MKKIILALIIALLLCGCEDMIQGTEGINEDFVASMESREGFDSLDVIVNQEVQPGPYSGTHFVHHNNSRGDVVRSELLCDADDTVIWISTYYTRTEHGDMSVIEYNRDFYDNLDRYGLPEVEYTPVFRQVSYYGKEYSSMGRSTSPSLIETYYAEGWSSTLHLINENGDPYLDSDEYYDNERGLIMVSHGDPEHGDRVVSREMYDEGTLVQATTIDYEAGTAEVTDYSSGEAVTVTLPVDEFGNIIE